MAIALRKYAYDLKRARILIHRKVASRRPRQIWITRPLSAARY